MTVELNRPITAHACWSPKFFGNFAHTDRIKFQAGDFLFFFFSLHSDKSTNPQPHHHSPCKLDQPIQWLPLTRKVRLEIKETSFVVVVFEEAEANPTFSNFCEAMRYDTQNDMLS